MEKWPKFYKVRQSFDNQPRITDLNQEVNRQLNRILDHSDLKAGSTIAIPAGSRGIAHIVEILKTVVSALQDLGFKPFLFSAMGSHGGGTKEGQREILDSLNITELSIGCPVIASSETVELGEVIVEHHNLKVFTAKEAMEADYVLLVNRIKAHTSFVGPHESGLLKMMAVGMGRANGASMVHSVGAEYLADSIPAIARKVIEHIPVIGGLAIVENAEEEIGLLKGLTNKELITGEQELLQKAKALMTRIPIKEIDFAVIKEMGKNYSGTGMDTNVIGRLRIEGMDEPKHIFIRYLAVLDLSEESHGNATGIGLADFTTEYLVDKIDKKATYLNCMTSGFVTRAAIPMTFSNDKELFKGFEQVVKQEDLTGFKMIVLKNTLHLDELWVSEAIYRDIIDREDIKVLSGPIEIGFDYRDRLAF